MAVEPNRRRLTVGLGGAGIGNLGAASGQEDISSAAHFGKLTEEFWSITSKTDAEAQNRKSFAKKDEEYYSKTAAGEPMMATAAPDKDAVKSKFSHVAWSCHKGLKPESPNQDSFSMTALKVSSGTNYLYGVYDGHGPKGHDVSDLARKVLVQKFLTDPDRETNTAGALTKAFLETQVTLHQCKQVDTSTSGTTCTLAYVKHSGEVTVAHIGDSRSVRYAASGKDWNAEALTEDHKPNLPKEKARIEAAGGRVVFDGFYNHRVFAAKGMYPGLNMSRAFGDDIAHAEAGLTAEPEVKEFNITESSLAGKELLLLICSDGVWEFIESDEALKIAQSNSKGSLQQQVEKLTKESWDRWMKDSENEISDDITGILVQLRAPQ